MYPLIKQGKIVGTTSQPANRGQQPVDVNDPRWIAFQLIQDRKIKQRAILAEVQARLPNQNYANSKIFEVEGMTREELDAYDPSTDTGWPV